MMGAMDSFVTLMVPKHALVKQILNVGLHMEQSVIQLLISVTAPLMKTVILCFLLLLARLVLKMKNDVAVLVIETVAMLIEALFATLQPIHAAVIVMLSAHQLLEVLFVSQVVDVIVRTIMNVEETNMDQFVKVNIAFASITHHVSIIHLDLLVLKC
jgi:hypothetical protein